MPGAWAVVFLDRVRGDLRNWLRVDKPFGQPACDATAIFERRGCSEFAQFFVGNRRGFEPVPGGFLPGSSELARAGNGAMCVLPGARPGAFCAPSGSSSFLGDGAEAIVC